MTETLQLKYRDEEVEDILLLCYANYFGRNKQKHAPPLTAVSNNALEDRCLTHLFYSEVRKKKRKFKVCFFNHRKELLSASFEMQSPRKIFQTDFINLKKWKTLNDLTGREGPEYSIDALLATRERNLRVLTIANFFQSGDGIPTAKEIRQVREAYIKHRYSIFS